MTTYNIYNATSGQDLGEYDGETEDEAIRAMLADAGCTDEPSDDIVAEMVPYDEDYSGDYARENEEAF